MSYFVVDVNVAVVANGKENSPQTNIACKLACVQELRKVQANNIVLDDADHIMKEYRKHLSPKGQPGVGDAFMHWIIQNQYTETICERVNITSNPDREFEEFPNDPDLIKFDPADRKYVAVAIKSNKKPIILNAVDSDWRDHEVALQKNGLNIKQLCPDCLK